MNYTASVSIKDARKNLSELVDRASIAGDTFLLTKFGKPKAVIAPVEEDNLELDKIIKAAEKIGAKKLILFGSRAFGKNRSDSDLDLCLVIGNNQQPLSFKQKLRKTLSGFDYQWPVGLDLHAYTEKQFNNWRQAGHPFIEEITKGKILYG